MKSLALVPLAGFLLALEGVLLAFFQVELAKPDPALLLVVALAFRPDAAAVWSVFGLGCLADAFAGAPTGLGALVYLPIFGMVRVALRFVVPERRTVQVGSVFFASLAASALQALLARLMGAGDALLAELGLWAIPMGGWNALLALLLGPAVRRLLGEVQAPGRLGAT